MAEGMDIYVLGAKKGESIVVRLPGERWGVVDNYSPELSNPQRNPTIRLLEELKVEALEFLCLTHPHEDHFRGMSQLLERFPVKCFWIYSGLSAKELHARIAVLFKVQATASHDREELDHDADEFYKILRLVTRRVKEGRIEWRGMQLGQPMLELRDGGHSVKVTALGPSGNAIVLYQENLEGCFDTNSGGVLAEKAPKVLHNQISAGLLIEYGATRIVLGGDMERKAWEAVLGSSAPTFSLKADLVKVSHHGSENGYCERLWEEELSPGKNSLAVITPYSNQRLPSRHTVEHIKAHAKEVSVTSRSAIPFLDQDPGEDVALGSFQIDVDLALKNVFRNVRHRYSARSEGCCCFKMDAAGSVTREFKGDAFPLS